MKTLRGISKHEVRIVVGSSSVSRHGHSVRESLIPSLGPMAPRFKAWDTRLWELIAKIRDWALSSARTLVRPSLRQSFDVCLGPSSSLAAGPVNH